MKKRNEKKNKDHTLKNKDLHDLQDPELFPIIKKEIESINFLYFPDFNFDVDKLRNDLHNAELVHPFVDKLKKTWKSIPLRSVDGIEGRRGNEGGNLNNSPDPDRFKDTKTMDSCPYIKEILDNLQVPLLKVRLMSLDPNRLLPEHTDEFNDDRILRIHIPIITHDDVLFYVNGESKNLSEGTMCYANVRKPHKVHNKSKIVRIHLVFDVWVTDEFIIKTLYPAIEHYKSTSSACEKQSITTHLIPAELGSHASSIKDSPTVKLKPPTRLRRMVKFKPN